MNDWRKKLIEVGVRNLREFGYPECNASNILTDPIYSAFFRSALEDNKGKLPAADDSIKQLISEIDGASNA